MAVRHEYVTDRQAPDPLFALLREMEQQGWALLRVIELPCQQIAVFTHAESTT